MMQKAKMTIGEVAQKYAAETEISEADLIAATSAMTKAMMRGTSAEIDAAELALKRVARDAEAAKMRSARIARLAPLADEAAILADETKSSAAVAAAQAVVVTVKDRVRAANLELLQAEDAERVANRELALAGGIARDHRNALLRLHRSRARDLVMARDGFAQVIDELGIDVDVPELSPHDRAFAIEHTQMLASGWDENAAYQRALEIRTSTLQANLGAKP